LASYRFNEPFHLYLAQAFKQQPGWGSRDRKRYRRWCYTYFKYTLDIDLGRWPETLNEQTLVNALLASPSTLEDEKIPMTEWGFEPNSTTKFSFKSLPTFSSQVDSDAYGHWFQQEPPVFVRRLKNWKDHLPTPLNSPNEAFLKFAPGTSLQKAQDEGICFIQDLGSQLSVQHECLMSQNTIRVWDACCGAGGKSLQMLSQSKQVDLVCSDIRKSILDNLRIRFRTAQLPVPLAFAYNPIKETETQWHGPDQFDRIVLDVPCTGSGTWRRNPEELHQFQLSKLEALVPIQSELLNQVSKRLKQGGYLFYITCSVFRQENEAQIEAFLSQHTDFEPVENGMLGGPSLDADYLFRAILRKIN
jgi:16S rRNA (cytosine967-C5)-methyltransferase